MIEYLVLPDGTKYAKEQPQTEYRLPPGRLFAYVLNNYQWTGVSRPTLNDAKPTVKGLPDTCKVANSGWVKLTKAWQFYWVDIFSLSKFGRLYGQLSTYEKNEINSGFASATHGGRAFTNGKGWNNGYADYVNNVNPNAPPMEQETIITGGNIVELVDGKKIRWGGKDVYRVMTLDGLASPPNPLEVNHIKTPWLVFKATISRREGYDENTKKWAREDLEIRFPQLDGADVPIPFAGRGNVNYIEAQRLALLVDNSPLPQIYYP